MKRLSIILLLLLICVAPGILAQKTKSKTTKRKVIRTVTVQVPKEKPEEENWQENDFKNLKIKLSFPKVPATTEIKRFEGGVLEVKSSIIQTYLNGNYYMIEVREYPKSFLPKRSDLGESYANWLKTYLLPKIAIVSEKSIDYGQYKGVEFVYTQTNKEVIVHRVFVVGDKLYQLLVQVKTVDAETVKQALEKNKDKIQKFLDSFELYEIDASDTA